MFFVDTFLGGAFLTYGTDVVKFSNMNQDQRTDPMVEVFPRVTKCTFHKYGPSGGIQKLDALCVLALNILNEKIYIFLWFWFIFLAIISGIALLYSMAVVLLPSTRETILKKRFKFGTPAVVSTLIRKTQVKNVPTQKTTFSRVIILLHLDTSRSTRRFVSRPETHGKNAISRSAIFCYFIFWART